MSAPTWTPEQVLALAPDAASAKSGRELSQARKWLNPGYTDQVLWGELQGSGSKPYQTIIELATPAFHCSCPSRKFPCKHGLGLFLVYTQEKSAIRSSEPPAWVAEWLAGRAKRAQQKAEKTSGIETSPEEQAASAAAQAKRAAARENKVAAGIDELERWLHDLIRNGLAQAQTQPHTYWSALAARLIDAQAPGLANWVNELAGIPASGAGWQDRLLDRLARLHLLIKAYKRIDTQPIELQADIRTLVGFTLAQEDVLARPAIRDHWLVQGQHNREENNLRVQRTWLMGEGSGQPALVLHFAASGQAMDTSLVVGARIDAELCFYPSAFPLRALVKQRFATTTFDSLITHATIDAALASYAAALSRQPWIERFPVALQQVTPFFEADRCWLGDEAGVALPIAANFQALWRLLALSGGQPLAVAGEWNGETILPLSFVVNQRVVLA